MRKAHYPQRTCGASVHADPMVYYCELAQGHHGPCATFSSESSVRARLAWEDSNPDRRNAVKSTTTIVAGKDH